MDLSTNYLGFELPHPLILGASPLVDDLDSVKQVEDGGAAAIVMHSLFEEQLSLEQLTRYRDVDYHAETFAEALTYLPEPIEFALNAETYLNQVHKIKQAVRIPLIASLNGVTNGGWLEYSALLEQAGADALELNVYALVTDGARDAGSIESETVEMVRSLRKITRLPIAAKLSPCFTSLAHFGRKLEQAGADALVIFNRFYQPDIDIEELEVEHRLELSRSSELLVRLRWLAILSSQLKADLAVTGGVHDHTDAIKAVMAGATAVQLVSEVLEHGPMRFCEIRQQMEEWLEEHAYDSLAQMRGSMNLAHSPNPAAYERSNYMRILQSWRRDGS